VSSERASPWIFSPATDLLAFTLPAAIALGVVALAPSLGFHDVGPDWLWLAAVVGVDVAHVWSTGFVTYLDPSELRRRPERYWLVPALGWVLGVLLYSLGGALWFWRTLAYVAVFHFVRQQYGWMALYRARAGDRQRSGALIDGAAIYVATLYPLVYWHTHLPRRFAWFLPGDFWRGVPRGLAVLAGLAYVTVLGAYAARALWQRQRGQPTPWGKHLMLTTTAATWYVGIVATNSDLAFTACNVLVHGIPYAVLVFAYGRHFRQAEPGPASTLLGGSGGAAALRFLACVWLVAFVEELLWDLGVWHERSNPFGEADLLARLELVLVPLLAVPQLTHYVLDGLFWRKASNPRLRAWLAGA
jgi:hypothetical protein